MSNSPNIFLDILRIFTDFLSNNMIIFLLMLIIVIFRKSISNLIDRLTSLNYKKGDSQIGIEAAAPSNEGSTVKEIPNANEKPQIKEKDEETISIEEESKDDKWFTLLQEGKIDEAKSAFEEWAKKEKDINLLQESKAFYLYLLYERGKDNTAIEQLEELAEEAKSERAKYRALTWLSYCLRDSDQTKKVIRMWESAIKSFSSNDYITRSIVSLSYALNSNEQPSEAKELLTERLKVEQGDAQKANIYSALSVIEKSLGNKSLSIYCKDKSLEYNPSDRDDLFDAAYDASQDNIDDISISNYITLLRLDSDNSLAMNNLGVHADAAGLEIEAVEKYKAASKENNTLAMANQGNLLLNAGFTEEAEKIAKEASEKESPHENVYNLLSSISKKKSEQSKKWGEITKQSRNKQKEIRQYTEQLYLGTKDKIVGEWVLDSGELVNIDEEGVNINWSETKSSIGGGIYTIAVTGEIKGSTFRGRYTKNRSLKSPPVSLLDYADNKDVACIGFISEDANTLYIVSENAKDKVSLSLKRKK